MKRSLPIARLSRVSASVAIGYGLLFLTLVGCPGNLDPSLVGNNGTGGGGGQGTGGGDGSCAQAVLKSPNCATSGCHGGPAVSAGLNLDWPVDPAKVVGVMPPAGTATNCTTQFFLDPGSSPPTGLLVENLQASTLQCGVTMPYLSPTLGQADIDCLKQWAAGLIAAAGSQ